MIQRYALPAIAALFTDEARFSAWLEVEILAVEAWAALGVVPEADAAAIRAGAGFDVAAVHERERVTEHDVAAFVDVVQERVGGPAAAWVHYGLTSSDVVDTALSVTLVACVRPAPRRGRRARAAITRRAREHRDTPMVGPHARHPRRAHDVRGQARAVGAAGPPGP